MCPKEDVDRGRASTSTALGRGLFRAADFVRYRCTRVYADDDAVRVVCSHTALAAFPGCCTDKNNKNSSLRREGREGILIVEWCTVGVKP